MHNPLMKYNKLNSIWIVHFLEDGHEFIDTEQLIFPTDLTIDNINAAMKAAIEECNTINSKFVSLDLLNMEDNLIRINKIWSFPRDLGCFT